jgi:tetratricopeptide (TPR) repeat protein
MSSIQIITTLKLAPVVAVLVLGLSPQAARAGDDRSIHKSPVAPIAQSTTTVEETPQAGEPSDGERGMSRTSEQPPSPLVEITPDGSSFYDRYMKAGSTANRQGDYQQALIFFQRALDEQPNDVFALQALTRVQAKLAHEQRQPAAKPSPQSATQ